MNEPVSFPHPVPDDPWPHDRLVETLGPLLRATSFSTLLEALLEAWTKQCAEKDLTSTTPGLYDVMTVLREAKRLRSLLQRCGF